MLFIHIHSKSIQSIHTNMSQTYRVYQIIKSCVLHMCLHLAHHLELHPISNKHTLPGSDTRCSPNATISNQLIMAFASLGATNFLYYISTHTIYTNRFRLNITYLQVILVNNCTYIITNLF